MTWIILAIRNIGGFLSRYPWPTACVILLLITAYLWNSRDNLQERYDKDVAEWQAKSKAAEAATKKAIADGAQAKQEADKTYEELSQDRDPVIRYVRDNRLPAQCSATRPASAETGAPGVPEASPTEAIVAVTETDIKACDGAWVYAQSAYEWGQSLVDKGLAN